MFAKVKEGLKEPLNVALLIYMISFAYFNVTFIGQVGQGLVEKEMYWPGVAVILFISLFPAMAAWIACKLTLIFTGRIRPKASMGDNNGK